MDIQHPNAEFDKWLGEQMLDDFDLPGAIWSPTTSDYQARELLEKVVDKSEGWWVELAYETEGDFPWHVTFRKEEAEYWPNASGYPFALVACQAVARFITNGDVDYE
ncbi:MAG: hypothetical protein ACXAEN_25490 [Candidatus Thorarchaeota archaeon]|jgi:hypothetical protein